MKSRFDGSEVVCCCFFFVFCFCFLFLYKSDINNFTGKQVMSTPQQQGKKNKQTCPTHIES